MQDPQKIRFPFLDWLRGLAVVSMVVFHFTYDWMVIGGANPSWPWQTSTLLWQQSICWLFIFLAGLSLNFSRNPLKGAAVLAACSLTVSVVTVLFLPNEAIWFGVLHFLALARLLVGLLRPLLGKIPPLVGFAGSSAIFLALHRLYLNGTFYNLPGISTLESLWVETFADKLLSPFRVALGMPPIGFTSSDYFGLIPWLFLFLAGYFVWPLVKNWRIWQKNLPVFDWFGRNSLLIYMLHQPLCYALVLGILWLV